jgi:hypothetical protein
VIRTAKLSAVWRGDYPTLESFAQVFAGSNHSRLQLGPAILRDCSGIEDRDGHK